MNTKVDYRTYIESEAWKERRVAALERSTRRHISAEFTRLRSPRCEFCGQPGGQHKRSRSQLDSKDRRYRVDGSNGLEVHHLTYKRLGCEEPDDLIVLCTDACYYDAYHHRYHAWIDRTRKLAGENNEEWRAKREAAGGAPSLPERIGCHERVHDDAEFRMVIAHVAAERGY